MDRQRWTLRDRLGSSHLDPAMFAEYGLFDGDTAGFFPEGDCVICGGDVAEVGAKQRQCQNCRISYRYLSSDN